jgi:5-methylcytosine-specific restriction endonuclease McrA
MNPSIAKTVLERDDYRCRGCGTIRNLELHHLQYRSHGGKDAADNLVVLCRRCHNRMHRVWKWAEQLRGWLTMAVIKINGLD